MIFKERDYGLLNIEEKGDYALYNHLQNIDPTLAEIQTIKQENTSDGWSKERTHRHVARIPDIEFLRHPEWMYAPELIERWLRTDEGKKYLVAPLLTKRSAQCIVK